MKVAKFLRKHRLSRKDYGLLTNYLWVQVSHPYYLHDADTTVCRVGHPIYGVALGFAVCGPNDEYSMERGEEIAFGRAIKKLLMTKYTREMLKSARQWAKTPFIKDKTQTGEAEACKDKPVLIDPVSIVKQQALGMGMS